MINTLLRLTLCSSLLFGAASATSAQDITDQVPSAQDIIDQANTQINQANGNTVVSTSNQNVTINGSGKRVVQNNTSNTISTSNRNGASRRTGSTRKTSSNSNGSVLNSNVTYGCTNNICTANINGVEYGPYSGSSMVVEIPLTGDGSTGYTTLVDGQVVAKF